MKKIGVVIAAILCIALVVGGFYLVKERTEQQQNAEQPLSEVQKLITKDLDKNYPRTPREVIKLYNRIITCYYKDEYTGQELGQLLDQQRMLFDAELAEYNSRDGQLMTLQQEIKDYKDHSRYIAQSDVCDSEDVLYKTVNEDELASVDASYFQREGSNFTKTYQRYILRKDQDGRWKILGWGTFQPEEKN